MIEQQVVLVDSGQVERWWEAEKPDTRITIRSPRSPEGGIEQEYLRYIVEHYETLAPQTLFLHSGAREYCDNIRTIAKSLQQRAGFVEIGDYLTVTSTINESGNCNERPDSSADCFLDEIASFRQDFVSFRSGALFAVSAEQIRLRPKSFYERALNWVAISDERAAYIRQHWFQIFADTGGTKRGLVTAADRHIYRDLQFMIQSLRSVDDHPLVVYDLGLFPYQLEWCLSQPGVTCRPIPCLTKSLANYVGQHRWQAWLKPAYLRDAPFDQFAWIDADCVVLRPLDDFFELLGEFPLLMPEVAPGCGANHADLYLRHLPIALPEGRLKTEINNGVIGLHRHRDRALLDAWLFAVEWAIEHPELRHLIRWYDQGALLWAVLQTCNEKNILPTQQWNFPARLNQPLLARALSEGTDLVESMRQLHPGASIVHWFGLCKLSIALADEIDGLFCPAMPRRSAESAHVELLVL